MLTHLHIRNYALISHLDIDFHEGFSVMTGETGAGKSIILGALSLVMGARADIKSITEGEDKCVIEATFSGEKAKGEIIIRRELSASGRSRSFINDEVVTQAELKAMAQQLIDIHSQHESLMIGDDLFQIEVVDAIAGNKAEREAYTEAYNAYQTALSDLTEAQALAKKIQGDADYMLWQYNQLTEAQLVEGEMEELEEEEYRLSHAEEIQSALAQALQQLDSERGALALIHATRIPVDQLSERLSLLEIELKDIVSDIQRQYDRTERDPVRLEHVQERISMLQTLMKKHRVQSVEELIQVRDELHEQVQRFENMDEELSRLEATRKEAQDKAEKAAIQLRKSRQAVTKPIADQLVQDLQRLGVPHANIVVDIQPTEEFAPTGRDNIQFLFAANLNQSLRPVADVASGGEISRLMLCIKALIANSNALPTIIFDEIDTGVSGAIASQMGEIMLQMAQARQIITITHLPQVAVRGEHHYMVYKQDTDIRTETHIRQLSAAEHQAEIEKMRQL